MILRNSAGLGPRLAFGSARVVGQIGRAAVDFLYPPVCPLCGREDQTVRKAGRTQPAFCRLCWDALLPGDANRCLRCGAPVGPHLGEVTDCLYCRRDRFAFESVIRLGLYEGPLRRACQQAKQRGGEPLAAALAELLWQQQGEALIWADVDGLVPIAHHWRERFRRSHFVPPILAETLASRLRRPWNRSLLVKVRHTSAQRRLPPSRRRTNLKGAFRVRGRPKLDGATILVLDDVLTTGATCHEAAKVLRRAGAERIIVAVVARGLGRPSAAGESPRRF